MVPVGNLMEIFEKCAVISCVNEVYEDEKRVLTYCLGHSWLDGQYSDQDARAVWRYADTVRPS